MATTEGALIRSYERGMVALTKTGGVQTAVLADENHTAPAFHFQDVHSAVKFPAWLESHFSDLKDVVASTTRHGKLTGFKCYQTGRQVIVNFGFRTGDAQGMNMIVRATDAMCRWVEERYPNVTHFLFSAVFAGRSARAVSS